MIVTIEGVDSVLNGTFTLDPGEPFNGDELHLIKDVAGVRLGELDNAIMAGDYDVFVAFAVIALIRSGRVRKIFGRRIANQILEAPAGAIQLDSDDEEEDEAEPVPPVKPPKGGTSAIDEANENSETS